MLHITDNKRGLIVFFNNKGGLMVFFKLHIPSRSLSDIKIPSNIQITTFEMNLRKEKWLVASIYNAPP